MALCVQVFTFTWREDIRPGDPQHTKKFCFDAVSHSSPVTLYDCHSMKGNQLWKYRKVRHDVGGGIGVTRLILKKERKQGSASSPQQSALTPASAPLPCHARVPRRARKARNPEFCVKSLES